MDLKLHEASSLSIHTQSSSYLSARKTSACTLEPLKRREDRFRVTIANQGQTCWINASLVLLIHTDYYDNYLRSIDISKLESRQVKKYFETLIVLINCGRKASTSYVLPPFIVSNFLSAFQSCEGLLQFSGGEFKVFHSVGDQPGTFFAVMRKLLDIGIGTDAEVLSKFNAVSVQKGYVANDFSRSLVFNDDSVNCQVMLSINAVGEKNKVYKLMDLLLDSSLLESGTRIDGIEPDLLMSYFMLKEIAPEKLVLDISSITSLPPEIDGDDILFILRKNNQYYTVRYTIEAQALHAGYTRKGLSTKHYVAKTYYDTDRNKGKNCHDDENVTDHNSLCSSYMILQRDNMYGYKVISEAEIRDRLNVAELLASRPNNKQKKGNKKNKKDGEQEKIKAGDSKNKVQKHYPIHNMVTEKEFDSRKLERLLGQGWKIRERNTAGHSPLHLAVLHENVEAFKAFCEADISALSMKDKRGFSPFQVAIFKGNQAFVELIRSIEEQEVVAVSKLHPFKYLISKSKWPIISELLLHCDFKLSVDSLDDCNSVIAILKQDTLNEKSKLKMIEKMFNIKDNNLIESLSHSLYRQCYDIAMTSSLLEVKQYLDECKQHLLKINKMEVASTDSTQETPAHVVDSDDTMSVSCESKQANSFASEISQKTDKKSSCSDLLVGQAMLEAADNNSTADKKSNITVARGSFTKITNEELYNIIKSGLVLKLSEYCDQGLDLIERFHQTGKIFVLLAVKCGNLEMVKCLAANQLPLDGLNQHAKNILPIHLAIRYGHSDIVRWLLDCNVDSTVRNLQGHTLAHLAVLFDRIDVLRILYKYGVSLSLRNEVTGFLPVHYAMINNRISILNFLDQHGEDLNKPLSDGSTVESFLLNYSCFSVLDSMVKKGINLSFIRRFSGSYELQLFDHILRTLFISSSRFYIGYNVLRTSKKFIVQMARLFQNYLTFIAYASFSRLYIELEGLYKRNMSANNRLIARACFTRIVLSAQKYGNTTIVKHFINHYFTVDFEYLARDMVLFLTVAIKSRQFDVLLFIDSLRGDNHISSMPLFFNNKTLMHKMIENEMFVVVRYIMYSNFDKHYYGPYYQEYKRMLSSFCQSNLIYKIENLEKIILSAIKAGNLSQLESLQIDGLNFNYVKKSYCLHAAVQYNKMSILIFLNNQGLSLANALNEQGDTLIHVAAQYDHMEMVSFLLGCGLNPARKNYNNETPLDLARNAKNDRVVLMLEEIVNGKILARKRSRSSLDSSVDKLPAAAKKQAKNRFCIPSFVSVGVVSTSLVASTEAHSQSGGSAITLDR